MIFEDCPIGFSKSDDKCICEQRLMKYATTCEDIYIMRNSGSRFWVNASYQNGTYTVKNGELCVLLQGVKVGS